MVKYHGFLRVDNFLKSKGCWRSVKKWRKLENKTKQNPVRNRGIKEVDGLEEKTISSYAKNHLF